jgi:hypothetical protein
MANTTTPNLTYIITIRQLCYLLLERERESFLLPKTENEVTVIRQLAALQPRMYFRSKPFVGKNITTTEFPLLI